MCSRASSRKLRKTQTDKEEFINVSASVGSLPRHHKCKWDHQVHKGGCHCQVTNWELFIHGVGPGWGLHCGMAGRTQWCHKLRLGGCVKETEWPLTSSSIQTPVVLQRHNRTLSERLHDALTLCSALMWSSWRSVPLY